MARIGPWKRVGYILCAALVMGIVFIFVDQSMIASQLGFGTPAPLEEEDLQRLVHVELNNTNTNNQNIQDTRDNNNNSNNNQNVQDTRDNTNINEGRNSRDEAVTRGAHPLSEWHQINFKNPFGIAETQFPISKENDESQCKLAPEVFKPFNAFKAEIREQLSCPYEQPLVKFEGNYMSVISGSCNGRLLYQESEGLISSPLKRVFNRRVDVHNNEFFVVECLESNLRKKYNFFMHHQPNVAALDRALSIKQQKENQKKQKKSENKNSEAEKQPQQQHHQQKQQESGEQPPLDFIFYFFDSLSRANFVRGLPRTVEWLRKLPETSDFVSFDFQRYNVVGTGTASNLPPMISGLPFRRFNYMSDRPVDIIWDVAQTEGYVTGYLDGSCVHNTNSLPRLLSKVGNKDFDHEKTLEMKELAGTVADHNALSPFCDMMKYMDIGSFFSKATEEKICFGGKFAHQYMLEYAEQFFGNYRESRVPRMLFSVFNEAHEGTTFRIRAMDQHLPDSLDAILRKNPNTVVFLVGDHGVGYGDHAQTDQGRLEKRLPAWFMVVPKQFLAKNPGYLENIATNQRKLVTGYDIYQTLKHIVSPSNYSRTPADALSASSVFLPIDGKRTCSNVNIPSLYCGCNQYRDISNPQENNKIKALVSVAFAYMKDDAKGCDELAMVDVLKAQQLITDPHDANLRAVEYLEIQFSAVSEKRKKMEPEVFLAYLYYNTTEDGDDFNNNLLRAMEVGTHHNFASGRFEELGVIRPNATDIQLSTFWHDGAQGQTFTASLVDPDGKTLPGKQFTVKNHHGFVQISVDNRTLEEGRWGAVVQDSKEKNLGNLWFLVVAENGFTNLSMKNLQKFYRVDNVVRVTTYDKHRFCTPPDAEVEYCICE